MRDRNRVPAAAPAPSPFDDLLRRVLSEPSRAQQVALATAELLEADSFLLFTEDLFTTAILTAVRQVLAGVPGIVAAEAMTAVYEELPETFPGDTAGEYAMRLRASAMDL